MTVDPRLTPARPDLAAESLRGVIPAKRYVAGDQAAVIATTLDMTAAPEGGELTTQLLFGESVTVYEADAGNGRAWVQNGTDGYVGYVNASGLGPPISATHRVRTLGAHALAAPDVKAPVRCRLPYAARLEVTGSSGEFDQLGQVGWVAKSQISPMTHHATDFVAEAQRLVCVPYLWGGRSATGLDCSALIQLSLAVCGHDFPRDSDMQRAEGVEVTGLRTRGDLVFWKGHVGVLVDPDTLLHANAWTMSVHVEPLATAISRIGRTSSGDVLAIRRLAL